MGPLKRARRRFHRGTPLCLLLLFTGLMAMHGLQASPGPMEMAAAPLASAGGPAHHHVVVGDPPGDHHPDHPSGQMCLGTLLVSLLVALLFGLLRVMRVAVAARPAVRAPVPRGGRSPPGPSLHRLSVLRL
ncbi:hypothetical protein GCM10009527_046380 [Actinomadura nitritigenes]|uniref:DUF2946 domain-containing protein n=1 Tax=Actinomadura nitritigenes TaxID=134602 RepID=A0ABS3R6W0_9ACTN|nr:DUF6153 family protein [Actinomadura nitritigenes]MBO2441797.1 hypothetical protein [Actinomadura nitritigenes]